MQCDTTKTKRWERSNLMWIVMEKTSKGKQKKRMTGWVNNQTLDPALYITSNAFNMNWKVNKKGCY
jgi:hypothetical protein